MTQLDRRWDYFLVLARHPMIGKDIASFNERELSYAFDVIKENAHKDTGKYKQDLNQLVVTDNRVRKKQATRMWACLLEAASAQYAKETK